MLYPLATQKIKSDLDDGVYIAKGLPPYKGIGSGIRRALEEWPAIDFVDDRDGSLFTATVHRTEQISSGKSSGKILRMLADNPAMTIPQLAEALGITNRAVEKQIAALRKDKLLERVGPAKGGHWRVLQ
jgi:ATP-dependent DNA helicase RecG